MDKLKGISKNSILNNPAIKIHLLETNIDIYNDIARIMVNKLGENNEKGNLTAFILPIGPRGQYERFAAICNNENISCRKLITIFMDEYLDENNKLISENHPISFRGFIKKKFYNLINYRLRIKPENILFPDPDNINHIGEIIDEIGEVDICFGGVGINGHIAFNEPINSGIITNDEFKKLKTRTLDISIDTIIINSINYGGFTEFIPKKCITIGTNEIFKSKELRFYLEHNWQSAALRKIIFVNPTPEFPATFIKEHKNSILVISKNVLDNYVF